MSITNASQLLSLLTLSSTALPIGAYCYSQGVESAIDQGLIHDEASSIAYFEEVLEMLLVRFELPVLKRLMQQVSLLIVMSCFLMITLNM